MANESRLATYEKVYLYFILHTMYLYGIIESYRKNEKSSTMD